MEAEFNKRFTAYRNGEWWCVWDLQTEMFGKYLNTWLMACDEGEARKMAKLLNMQAERTPLH